MDFTGVPPAAYSVLSAMLDRQAAAIGDRTLIVYDTGESWTYREAQRQARCGASALARLGVGRDDAVLVWLPNGVEIVRVSFALSYLGAVFVPVNLALRGGMLEHIVVNSGARTLICHVDLIDRLGLIDTGTLETVVVVGGPVPAQAPRPGLRLLPHSALDSVDEAYPQPSPPVAPWDTAAIFYTSGTTGPSKGVVCPHLHIYAMGRMTFEHIIQDDDRFLISLPYFHLGGALVPSAMIGFGASMAMMSNYRTSTFWEEVKKLGASGCFLLGAVSNFLMKQEPRADDAAGPMRFVIQQPLMHDSARLAKRFGVLVYTEFDMSEMGPAIVSEPIGDDFALPNGYCGRPRQGWPFIDVRVVDENDCEAPPGVPGELVARCATPWVISPGYYNMPAATAKAWRNGWFHTGDSMWRDDDGNLFFVDRLKDSIRRRGENISATELEEEALLHEAVAAAAAIAAKTPGGDEEVLLIVQPKAGRVIEPDELVRFLIPRLPHYAVPRFIRVLDRMPLTLTNKIQKSQLRADGVTPDTWDREAAGIHIKRERIGQGA